MTRAKRERLQPVKVMYVRIFRSAGERGADTCGDSTKITFYREMLSFCFITFVGKADQDLHLQNIQLWPIMVHSYKLNYQNAYNVV